MNEKQNWTVEQLTLYHDNLLRDRERREVEEVLGVDEEARETLQALKSMDMALKDWGAKNRAYDNIVKRLNQPKKVQESPGWNSGFLSDFLSGGMALRYAGAFATVLTIILVFVSVNPLWNQEARILHAKGDYQIDDSAGTQLEENSLLALGNDSFMIIEMGDKKSRVDVGPNTKLKVTGPRSFEMKEGKIWTKVAPDPDNPYKVVTPHGVVTVLGTAFEVQVLPDKTIVSVEEGTVALNQKDFQKKIKEGQQAEMQLHRITPAQNISLKKVARWRSQYLDGILTTRSIADVLSR